MGCVLGKATLSRRSSGSGRWASSTTTGGWGDGPAGSARSCCDRRARGTRHRAAVRREAPGAVHRAGHRTAQLLRRPRHRSVGLPPVAPLSLVAPRDRLRIAQRNRGVRSWRRCRRRRQAELGLPRVLGLIGGGPTFVGTLIGQSFVNETLNMAFLALAAGSILYVVVQLLHVADRLD